MEIILDKNKESEQTLNISSVRIVISDDCEFRILVNKFGELEIQKVYFGADSGNLVVEPKVSNEIIIR